MHMDASDPRDVIALSHYPPPPQPLSTFEEDFYKIQLAAARLVSIQEKAKHKGTLTADDNKVYADSLIELGKAAQNLAMLQQTGQIQDFSVLFQPTNIVSSLMPQKQPPAAAPTPSPPSPPPSPPPPQPAQSTEFFSSSSSSYEPTTTTGEQKGDEATEANHQLSVADLLSSNQDDPYEDVHDNVGMTMATKKDASVAEARPVGLSIAGIGGVASSKPNGVALSGQNGLAVSAPRATAIAGVSPEEAAAFNVNLPSRRSHFVLKKVQQPLNQLQPQRIDPLKMDEQHYSSSELEEHDYVDFDTLRSLPMDQPDIHMRQRQRTDDAVRTIAQSKASAVGGDAFVNKWKALIAEDYAVSA